jgi:hypothetical protein
VCMAEDIAFLQTHISSDLQGRSSVNEKQFRNVSIITNLNSQKDEINQLGSKRFAAKTNQQLQHFFSVDMIPSKEPKDKHRGRKDFVNKKHTVKNGSIPAKIQQALWEQPTCANTKLIPGKLSVCIGMPIMIHNNAATEMCITKGQEAVVYSWDCHQGINHTEILDTLFVQLVDPPLPIKLDGLLLDDTSIMVSRNQVEALPNFAMTDYVSQGKMCLHNVIDLSQC